MRNITTCRCCGSDAHFMGALGSTRHYRCEGCGMDVSRSPKPKRPPSINALLKPLGVKVLAARCGNRYLGYSYFVDLKTGAQVGESVLVYRQNQLTHAQWIEQAKAEIARDPMRRLYVS